jgi:hypothetical protein
LKPGPINFKAEPHGFYEGDGKQERKWKADKEMESRKMRRRKVVSLDSLASNGKKVLLYHCI